VNEHGQVLTWAQFARSAKVDTFERSTTLVKKQMAAFLSSIMFVRGLFEETDYEKKSFDGVPFCVLKPKSKDSDAKKVDRQILGAFDALEKRYLRKLKMIIYLDPDQPNVAHEIYTIKVSYHEGLPELDVDGLEQLKTSASALIRGTLQLTEGLDDLPQTAYIGFTLDYVDEDTPEDYEPPGFQQYSETLVVPTGSRRLEMGKMTTSYHSVGLKVTHLPGEMQSPDEDYSQFRTSQESVANTIP